MIRNVTVYCSSSAKPAAVYRDAAAELGRAIGKQGWGLVYGGNRVGMMGILADAAREAGAKVIGITPQFFIDEGFGDDACHEMVVTNDMRDRKAHLETRGDALIALPGGIGTFEEILDALVGRHLGRHPKPIVLLDIAGYYRPLVTLIEHGIELHFIKPRTRELYFVAETVCATMDYLRSQP